MSRFRELALNNRVNQEHNCKEGKGQAMLDYWLGEFVSYQTRYNKKARVA